MGLVGRARRSAPLAQHGIAILTVAARFACAPTCCCVATHGGPWRVSLAGGQALRIMTMLSTGVLFQPILNSILRQFDCASGETWLSSGLSCFGDAHITLLCVGSAVALVFAMVATVGVCPCPASPFHLTVLVFRGVGAARGALCALQVWCGWLVIGCHPVCVTVGELASAPWRPGPTLPRSPAAAMQPPPSSLTAIRGQRMCWRCPTAGWHC